MELFQKHKYHILALAELILVIGLIVYLVSSEHSVSRISVPLSDWSSDVTTWQEYWAGTPDIYTGENDESIDLIYGPYIALPQGSYSAVIDYVTDNDQTVHVHANAPYTAFVTDSTGLLKKDRTSMTYRFEVGADIDNFELLVRYNGQGSILIKNIRIYRNSLAQRSRALLIVSLLLLLDLVLFLRKKGWLEIPAKVFAIALLASVPLMISGTNYGHDFGFHLDRIEGIAWELSYGQFPVRMSSWWMDGYGYPVSIFYGDAMLYFPALLRLAGVPVVITWQVFLFAVNLLTAAMAYLCFRSIFSDRTAGLLLSLTYTTATYRMVDVYVRSAAGEFCAIAFFPVVALALWQICTEEKGSLHSSLRHSLLLALGMTGIIESHILSTYMVVCVLVLFCIILLRRTIRRYALLAYALAVIETVLLNLGFLVPFLDYYLHVPVRITDKLSEEQFRTIQDSGAYIGQYVSFFQNPFGLDALTVNKRLAYTPGIILMSALIIAVLYLVQNREKLSRKLVFYCGSSVFLLWAASNLFPYNWLASHTHLGKMLAQIQFPWRFVALAILPLTFVTGELLFLAKDRFAIRPSFIVIALTIFSVATFTGDYMDNSYIVKYYDSSEFGSDLVSEGEYLRSGTNYSQRTGRLDFSDLSSAELVERKGTRTVAKVMGGSQDGWLEFPVYNYQGYQAVDEQGKSFAIEDGTNNVVRITIPASYEGQITLDYHSPLSWRISELVTLLAWAMLLGWAVWTRRLKRRKDSARTTAAADRKAAARTTVATNEDESSH